MFLGTHAFQGCNYSSSTSSGPQSEKGASMGSSVAEPKPKTVLPDNAVAVVDGIPITQEDFDLTVSQFESMDPEQYKSLAPKDREKLLARILDQMIMINLELQEAKRHGFDVPEDLVEQEYEDFKATFPSEKEFLDALDKAKTSPVIWKKGMREALLMRQLEQKMASRLVITEDEITSYWNANRAVIQKDMIHSRQILVRTEGEARKVLTALKGGMPFDLAVKEYSVDHLTKAKGGDLGWISRGEGFEEFEKAVFSLKPQEISGTIKGKYGYHIVQVLGKKDTGQTSMNDYREKIGGIIRQNRWQSERTAWLQNLKSEATVDRNLTSH